MAHLNSPYGTLSFPSLFQPRARAENSEPVYSAVLIFDADQQKTPQFKALKTACVEKAKEKFGPNVNLKEVKFPFRDAGEKAGSWGGFEEGDIFISPWSKSKPTIVDARRQEIFTPEDVWAGQLVRMNLTPFHWVNSGRKGISFALNHVQIVNADRPRIDGRGTASSVFDDGAVEGSDEPSDIF
jgi:hypothetical protein